MQDYLTESLALQRIDFFIKLLAANVGECSDDEKCLAIQWVSELLNDVTLKIRDSECS
ncbi:hypothetical protein C7M52_00053 [Mixta theicola]|nr:hypothetical protein [Mixta theicola]QHM74132.1 hypothetical protein C7M52_00053 [Mixta theicola]